MRWQLPTHAADTGSGSSTFLQRVWNSCLQTINKVKRQINPKLKIEGILLTMVDNRTNYCQRDRYFDCGTPMEVKSKCLRTDIPRSVRAEEISAEGKSIFEHDPNGKVAEAYRNLDED